MPSDSDSSEPAPKKKPVVSSSPQVKPIQPVAVPKPKRKQSSDESSEAEESQSGLHEAKYNKFNKTSNIFSNNPLHKANK